MSNLDRSRPYGEHWGSVGLSGYTQDNREFGLDGKPIEPPPKLPARPAKAGATPAPKATPKAAPSPDGDLSDDELRTKVEIAGGVWSDRAAALAFLDEDE